jgi:predicted DsbA family dithiol-disulfide isomerase
MQVEIWSDVMCPWCAVGKARFEQALEAFPHRDEVEVRWRSFELDPDAPEQKDGEYVELLASKYGTSRDEAQRMIDTMTATAAAEGLDFHFQRVRPGNTFDAHRLLHLAADRGLQHELKDRLLTAYLTEGETVGRAEVLQRLASEVGLDDVEVKEALAGDAYADAVREDERQAMAYGIRGVPFFVLDGRYGISGAQPADVLGQALAQAHAASRPLEMVGDAGEGHDHGDACADGSCAV